MKMKIHTIGSLLFLLVCVNVSLAQKQWKQGIDHQQEFPDVLVDFKKGVNSKLGQLKLVSVPPHLKEAYEELVSFWKEFDDRLEWMWFWRLNPRR
jgi:hypothetical protein